jgi:hypothetical protein
MSEGRKRGLSSSSHIASALGAGILFGIFLGELAAFLSIVADGYVKLLQMTVLPYVTISLISGLGTLQYQQAKTLFFRVGSLMVLLWGLTLVLVLLMPLSFPSWESASFFSTALVQPRQEFDFIGLYIPANPFHSLANNIVPAVVLFSALIGIALIGIEKKEPLIEVLTILNRALSAATRFVVRLTPIGVFAIAANAAGTMSVEGSVSFRSSSSAISPQTAYCDVVMSGFVVTTSRAATMAFSAPYLHETVAFLVPGHRRSDFATRESILAQEGLRIGIPDSAIFRSVAETFLPDTTQIVLLEGVISHFDERMPHVDALLVSAERGSFWTLLHPAYSVVVPQPGLFEVPVAYPVARRDQELARFLTSWIELKKGDGTLDALYDYWILGRNAVPVKPRWSIVRDVLHWID